MHLVCRDEIGTCLDIEVEIDVTDISPFFIRPYHVKEEDKNILDREMKRLHYLGILKEVFQYTLNSAYNKVACNENLATMKENLCTKYSYSPINTSPLTKSHL